MVMKELFVRFMAWCAQKRRAWWERKRAKGMFRYVLWVTYMFGGWMIVVSALFDYREYHNLRFDRLLFPIIVYPIAGFFIGLIGWLDNERKYNRENDDR
jgi:UDP-N-acetylmuramyl pentapeptide phosphotransferase/UDP-N-acetylglucosamine-1-phosphate transferase